MFDHCPCQLNGATKVHFKESQVTLRPYLQFLQSAISGMQDQLLVTWIVKYWNLVSYAHACFLSLMTLRPCLYSSMADVPFFFTLANNELL